jgi:hypothetical protein
MHKSFKTLALPALAAMLLAAAPASASVFVAATSTTPVALATVVAGASYTLTASGVANIYDAGGLDFDADGNPTHPIGGAYADLNTPGCCYSDPSSPGTFGPAGLNGLLGSLVGTFAASPTSAADYFQLGSNFHFTAASDGTLYGLVNDATSAYGDNRPDTGFTVSVTADQNVGGIPEPGTWALMILGLGGMGASLRRGRRHAAPAI